MPEETILIVTDDVEESSIDGQRGWGSVQQRLSKVAEIPVSVLEQNMNSLLRIVGRLFQQVDQQVGSQSDLCLDEVTLQVEISAKGEVKLFAGGEAAGKGVITLKFKRPS
ncbi:Pepco domain-containing protein [Nostoc sp.]|uniref:Pepco domain-containing protein n=1 Tax=Nostoc sp. TaxID=1180 RepID=UPI002FFB6C48